MDEAIKFDFDLAPYAKLRDELLPDGIICGWNSRHQMTVSYQTGPIWPNSNSFWVTHATGKWLLFPWYLDGYAIQEEKKFADLCRSCLESTDSVLRFIPSSIADEFCVRLLNETESSEVFPVMQHAG